MTREESTVANADLWQKYFQDQWSWLSPRGSRDSTVTQMAAGSAARVAGLLTLVAAGPIAWMYANSAANVRPLRPVVVTPPEPVHELESVEDAA